MPTKITTLTVNELGQASASKAAAAAASASADAAAASAAAALAAENSLLEWKGPWVTATGYAPSDLVEENGNTYVCVQAHTSGTFSTDLGNSLWELFAAKGDTGPGSGDLLAANNLSDVASIPTARANLGISTFGATLVDDTDAEAARTTLGLGTSAVEAYNTWLYTSAGDAEVYSLASNSKTDITVSAAYYRWVQQGRLWTVQGRVNLGASLTTGASEYIAFHLAGPAEFGATSPLTNHMCVGQAIMEDESASIDGYGGGLTSYGLDFTIGNFLQFGVGGKLLWLLTGSTNKSYASGDRILFTATHIDAVP